jgi:hypothetical protein
MLMAPPPLAALFPLNVSFDMLTFVDAESPASRMSTAPPVPT